MPLTWIDAHIEGDQDEEQPRKENEMAKTIKTDKRLYDTDAHGIKFLKYPVGADVPEAEYKRLAAGAVENKKRTTAENKAEVPAEKPLKQMNKAELTAVASAQGIEVHEGMTNRELIEAITAPADADTDEADEADTASGDEE